MLMAQFPVAEREGIWRVEILAEEHSAKKGRVLGGDTKRLREDGRRDAQEGERKWGK